jgi:hypothetical protein
MEIEKWMKEEPKIKKMLEGRRLQLNARRFLVHYSFPVFFGISAIAISIALFSNSKNFDNKYFPVAIAIVMIVLPAIAVFTFITQYKALRFIEIGTPFLIKDNHRLVMQVFHGMRWKVKQNQYDFVEAYSPKWDKGTTWGYEMMSVIIAEKKILVNCICSVDTIWFQVGITFGRTKQWVGKFKEHFFSLYEKKTP